MEIWDKNFLIITKCKRAGSDDCLNYWRFILDLLISEKSVRSMSASSLVKSFSLSGATEISRTARNSPQLLRCSFSSRKKFQTKRRNISSRANRVEIVALLTVLSCCMKYLASQANRSKKSSTIAKKYTEKKFYNKFSRSERLKRALWILGKL